MYDAVRIVKMYAWTTWMNASKNVITMANRNANGERMFSTSESATVSMYSPPKMKTSSSRWPASMLPNNRRESVTGRRMKFEMNSIGVSTMRTAQGTPGGQVCSLM